MIILSVETSAHSSSVAVTEDGKVLSKSYVDTGLTHSQTLMPMIDSTLKNAMISIEDIDFFSVAAGPGSFTGVRIGISAVKGLAFSLKEEKNCISVSTLEGMANVFYKFPFDGMICPVMDARRSQIYTALFNLKNGEIIRELEDSALKFEELWETLKGYLEKGIKIIIMGDGTEVFSRFIEKEGAFDKYKDLLVPAPLHMRYQDAVGVAAAAEKKAENPKNHISARELLPLYLRLPQAERELKEKA